jgi:hypothetical protein
VGGAERGGGRCFSGTLGPAKVPTLNVMWVYLSLSQNGVMLPLVADAGDGLQIWRVATNILKKQSRTVVRVGFPEWGLGVGNTAPRSNSCNVTQSIGTEGLFGALFQVGHQWRVIVNTVVNLRYYKKRGIYLLVE